MINLTNLENVNALVLPSTILVLLSKYARALEQYERTIIKLSSLSIFKHVEQTYQQAKHPALSQIYHQLLNEVNSHIKEGTMYTNDAREKLSNDIERQAINYASRGSSYNSKTAAFIEQRNSSPE